MKIHGSFTDAEPNKPPAGMYVPIEFPSLALLGTRTRDGRLIDHETFEPFELPRSIKLKTVDAAGHDGAEVAGRLDEVTIHDDGNVSGRGWALNDANGRRAAYLIKTQALRGNSVDLSVREQDVDVRIEETEDGDLTFEIDFRHARLAATTLLTEPAFENAGAVIPEGWTVDGVDDPEAVVASVKAAERDIEPAFAFSVLTERPKLRFENFQQPKFTEPTPAYVDEADRVLGHLAAWGVPHLSHPGVFAPRSQSNYAYFASRFVETDEGRVATGCLSIDGDHAAETLGWRDALDHYANTCLAWADIAIGEDEWGIWFSGQVRPGTAAEVVHAGAASATSGDWRRIGAHLELVAALSVNTPGFPIPRPRAFGHDADFPMTVLSAGLVVPRAAVPPVASMTFTVPPALDYLARRFAAEEAKGLVAELDALGDF